MDKTFITTLNYHPYFYEQLKVLMTSMAVCSPNQELYVILVNFPDKEFSFLRKKFSFFRFENRFIEFKEEPSQFMVCYRTTIMLEFIEKIRNSVAWIDTDTIIRKDLSCFWDDIDKRTLKVLSRKTDEIISKFQCGVFGIGYSDKTIKYLKDWDTAVQSNRYWISEQENLYIQYIKNKDTLDLVKMSRTYNDVGRRDGKCFFDGSHIWHSKSKHFNNKKFQKEFTKYMEVFNGTDQFTS